MRAKPQVLQTPETTYKETHPDKILMAAQSRSHDGQTLLGQTLEKLVLEHKDTHKAIEKNKKWKEKIQYLKIHASLFGRKSGKVDWTFSQEKT